MASVIWRIGIAAFLLAFGLRFLNLSLAFVHGVPQITPADELYHWKRMEFSSQHFPQVLELDRDRGENGAFCPWPPLYDLFGGAVARVFGTDAVVWIPPVLGALFVALAAMIVAARFGGLAGATAGLALACSPFIVTQSWIGAIDHHYLEWFLVFGILICSLRSIRGPLSAAIAMTAALFVQTALIVACGLSFLVFFARGDRRASGAFFASAIAVMLYRITRSPGYPNSAWFLGWPHVLLLLAAGVALLVRPRWLGLACGIAIALTAPLGQGLHFFGGDPWLRTIIEFQPMWRSHGADLLSQVIGLGAGAILVWKLIPRQWPIALFAIVFLALTIDNRRFWSISIPLLAIAGAVAAASIENVRVRWLAGAAIALIPAMQLAAWMQHPQRPIERYEVPWIRAAEFLRTQPAGRVLAPWSMGHTFDVIGKHAVIIDGFGTMPDAAAFWRADAALRTRDEGVLSRYCDAADVRYVVTYVDTPPLPARFRMIYRSDPSFFRAAVQIWEYGG